MKYLVFLGIIVGVSGCMIQDAHDGNVREQSIEDCSEKCDGIGDCFSDQNGHPECGRREKCKSFCQTRPDYDAQHLDERTMERLRQIERGY